MGQREERQKEPSYRSHSMHISLPLRAGAGQKQRHTGCGGGYWVMELGESWCFELLWAKHCLGSLCPSRAGGRKSQQWFSKTQLCIWCREAGSMSTGGLCAANGHVCGEDTLCRLLPAVSGYQAEKHFHKTVNVCVPSTS